MGPTWVLSAPDGPHVGPHEPCFQGHYDLVMPYDAGDRDLVTPYDAGDRDLVTPYDAGDPGQHRFR